MTDRKHKAAEERAEARAEEAAEQRAEVRAAVKAQTKESKMPPLGHIVHPAYRHAGLVLPWSDLDAIAWPAGTFTNAPLGTTAVDIAGRVMWTVQSG